jgi:hypothetical protein
LNEGQNDILVGEAISGLGKAFAAHALATLDYGLAHFDDLASVLARQSYLGATPREGGAS